MSAPEVWAGLDSALPALRELWGESLRVEPPMLLLGSLPWAGSPQPAASSVARVTWGSGRGFWIPVPDPDAKSDGPAPLYLHAGRRYVLPTIRLLVDRDERGDDFAVEYVAHADWLHDALRRWRFPTAFARDRIEGAPAGTTVIDWIRAQGIAPEQGGRLLAGLIRFALFGSDRACSLRGLRMPPCPMWLRPVEGNATALRASRHLVISARLRGDTRGQLLPSSDLRAARYRLAPNRPQDWGVDPVHTPEGSDIRLTGRLGVDVTIEERRLCVPKSDNPPLSPSTACLPFAGFNDPRRLLMAANMQLHAIPIAGQEAPRVLRSGSADDPPGTNLRTGYLAWQGWNHEDAWVLSESAALKLAAAREVTQTIGIRAVEMPPRLLVGVGQQVARGERLVERHIIPLLIATDVAVLARHLDVRETVVLRPEFGDEAEIAGEVASIEQIGVTTVGSGEERWRVSPELASGFRTIIRITVRQALPLQVGDKLANRHGHKGIVGAILPDDQMPRWQGQALEALIDPISVLNRSNWGQVLEALAGAVSLLEGKNQTEDSHTYKQVLDAAQRLGADSHGRWPVDPPDAGSWLTAPIRAVAGVQFVMRMPQHAADKLSGSPRPPGAMGRDLRQRAQRLGEMDQWALWAHGVIEASATQGTLTPAARLLARLLASAGFSLTLDNAIIALRRLPIDAPAPDNALPLPYWDGTLGEVFDCLEEVGEEPCQILVFDPPVEVVPLPSEVRHATDDARIAWLPIVPARDRPPRMLCDGSHQPHLLTQALRRVVRAARAVRACAKERTDRPDAEAVIEEAERNTAELRYAVAELRAQAYELAVGARATGPGSSKLSILRRRVLGSRRGRSARATISPVGNLGLGLDEVGIPPVLAWTLFGPDLPDDPARLADAVNGRDLWLKRDPVLHRWGLLPVRARLIAGATVRLAASILGPLGGDYDGDTVALFAALPGAADPSSACRPAALAWHGLLDRAMFLPTKQYLYGLHLLRENPAALAAFAENLRQAAAPAWPEAASASVALQQWVRDTAPAEARPEWWSIVERHALAGLAGDPSMGFGLYDVDSLAAQPVIVCGAAKNLYDSGGARATMAAILAGQSLHLYRLQSQDPTELDPIAEVMVAAKAAIGRFGGALRRLIYSADSPLEADTVGQAQALTEQVTQKALSVKGGKPPVRYAEYERQLRRLLKGQPWEPELVGELLAILEPLEPVWTALQAAMPADPPAWLRWLRNPYELATILAAEPDGMLRLPADDLRVHCWSESAGEARR
jgi:hypothetical protein